MTNRKSWDSHPHRTRKTNLVQLVDFCTSTKRLLSLGLRRVTSNGRPSQTEKKTFLLHTFIPWSVFPLSIVSFFLGSYCIQQEAHFFLLLPHTMSSITGADHKVLASQIGLGLSVGLWLLSSWRLIFHILVKRRQNEESTTGSEPVPQTFTQWFTRRRTFHCLLW